MIMFNSQSTTVNREKSFLPVTLTLVDGERLRGAIAVPKQRKLGDLLNSSDKYVLFKTNTGEPVYLAQTTIAAVQSNAKPAADQLDHSLRQFEQSNPYHILGVEPGVDKASLRQAYHEMVKHYHPDQFANVTLPREMSDYIDSVIARLNAAYQELLDEIDRLEEIRQRELNAQQKPATGNIRYFGQ